MLQNYDLIAIVGLKGGVGKTNSAWHILPAVLQNQNQEFKIFEIDDNNDSNFFTNSSIIRPETCQTVRTNDKNIVAQIVVETIAGDTKILVDAGGGNDSRKTISLIKSVGDDVRKLWLIPFDRNIDNFKSALSTAELINDPLNTVFVLNGYSNDKSEFDWFYSKNIDNYIEIPYSDLFHFSQEQKYTVHDLALISKTVPKSEIKNLLRDKFTKDGVLDSPKFIEAFNEYLKSENAAELLNEVFVNFAQKKSQNRKKN
jgi:hypothetical protein